MVPDTAILILFVDYYPGVTTMIKRRICRPSINSLLRRIRVVCDNLFMLRFEPLCDRQKMLQIQNKLDGLICELALRRLGRKTATRVMQELGELEDLAREGVLFLDRILWIALRQIRERAARAD